MSTATADLAPGSEISLACPRITRTALALYAGASGDHNPVHIDLDACRAVGIDDVFAHGMLSMAYLGTLLSDHWPQGRIASFEVRFSAITPVNSEPTCTGTITRIQDGLAHLDLAVTLADGTVTLTGAAAVRLD
jgi:acyl dehydratase